MSIPPMAAPAALAEGPAPASAWIRFLRTYGPSPNNSTLFDEYVVGALSRAKVEPITLSSPQLERIVAHVQSGAPGSVLIAGTAGDGKTYHCRSLWSRLGGSAAGWAAKGAVKELALADGRVAVFVKDLTELNDQESDEALGLLEASVLGAEDARLLVLVANHGQVLERLRDAGRRQDRAHPLRLPIQEAFLQERDPPPRLALFDLSRSTRAESVNEVLLAVANHPEWEKCKRCSYHAQGAECPIVENRERMLGRADDGLLRRRLGSLADIARLNGWHLPVRDLLALAANMILGHPDAKEGLMACADVPKLRQDGLTELASIYDNVFGRNLPLRRAMSRPVFRALSVFGVGSETTNGADGLLVYGMDDPKLRPAFDRLVGGDSIYGATTAYRSSLRRYLEGEEAARLEEGAAEFLARLVSQRRRLFFTLPDSDADYPHWPMTAFRFGGAYLALVAALGGGKGVGEPVREMLVRGLNRVMTGLLMENTDKLFVASSGGFTQSRISVLCDTEAPGKRSGGIGMRVRLEARTGRPAIEIALAQGDEFSASFSLAPVRFEFLCRVSGGALPASFSNECLEDMLAFKAKLLRKAELLRASAPDEDDDGGESLALKFIEVEQSGHGYSKPVFVRTPA